jgi:hypothetical protein
VSELEGLEGRERKRGPKEQTRFRDAVRCLVLDLYVAWKIDPELVVGISLSNSDYTAQSRYRAIFIWWSSFKAAYELLDQTDYIEVVKHGFNDPRSGKGRVTRIRATKKLIQRLTGPTQMKLTRISRRYWDEQVIILRAKKPRTGTIGSKIEYEDTAETRLMRERLGIINAHLQKQWIDIRITDAEFAKLQRRMRQDYEDDDRDRPFIDLTQRSLVRIFNNGDWEQGGRFYGGWWQSVPKEYRKRITINDKRTNEVDFSTLHPVLLYAQVGERLVGDAYDIGLQGVQRDLVKKTFNMMLNARDRINAPKAFAAANLGMSWAQLQQAIRERHAPIASFFNSGYGLKLQRLDADLAEAVMLRFMEGGNACLPVHDSFLVHHARTDDLTEIMAEEFKRRTGQNIATRLCEGHDPELEAAIEQFKNEPDTDWNAEVDCPIEDYLVGTGEYAGYEQRQLDWLSGLHKVGSA